MTVQKSLSGGKENSFPPHSNNFAIKLSKISKRFGNVVANDSVDLQVEKGTIHGIVGENGAGKSTLMSILFGFYKADSGTIQIEEDLHEINSSQKAISLGIGMVHQHFMLVPPFTVLENVMLGNEGGFLLSTGLKVSREYLIKLSNDYGLNVNPDHKIEDLPVGMQQRVEILKALSRGAKILVLDEPTGVLTPQETEALFEILHSLKTQGVTIIFITHKLKEIMAVTDNVSVMRAGKMVAHLKTRETSTENIAELMVGRKVLLSVNKTKYNPGNIILEAKNISLKKEDGREVLKNITFKVKEREILGIAGVAGNGQSELLEVLSGMQRLQSGEIIFDNKLINSKKYLNPKELRGLSVSHVPEDRQARGIVLPFENRENAILGFHDLSYFQKGLFMDGKILTDYVKDISERFDVRPNNSFLKSANLSGGNQQKLVLAREIDSKPKLFLVGQPTRGVDIGAIEFIHKHLLKMRDNGAAVLLVSVELDEIMSLSDRIIVMNNGEIVDEVISEKANEKDLGLLMAGIKKNEI